MLVGFRRYSDAYTAAAELGICNSQLFAIPDHLKALGTIPALAGQIPPNIPEIIAKCIITSLPIVGLRRLVTPMVHPMVLLYRAF